MMHQYSTAAAIVLLLSCLVNDATASDWSSFLRRRTVATTESSTSTESTTEIQTPYDDLLKCMWNGTTVGACHSLSCSWCHSSFADICVTAEYAANLDGQVFTCEGGSTDDDAPTTDDDAPATDDDSTPTPEPTPSPVTDPPTEAPDDVLPIDDDGDENHDANEKYEQKLLHCLSLDAECLTDESCTICTFTGGSMCFSKQAAKQMDGAYYHCTTADAAEATQEDVIMVEAEE